MLVDNDPIRAQQLFHTIAEEIDDARHDFIMAMREGQAEVEAEVVDEDDEDDELEDVRAQSEESLQ